MVQSVEIGSRILQFCGWYPGYRCAPILDSIQFHVYTLDPDVRRAKRFLNDENAPNARGS